MNETTKLMTVFLSMLFLTSLVFAQERGATITESAIVNAISVSNATFYEPYPAEPGSYIDVWVRAQYLGTGQDAEEVFCGVSPTYPFTIEPGDVSVNDVGRLSPYDEVVLKYRVRIDTNAIQGTNDLKFGCKTKGFDWAYTDLPIFVQAQDAIINVESIVSNPEDFAPSEEGMVKITLKNIGPVTLKDISVRLDLSSETLPFAPIESTTEKRINSLTSGQSVPVEFSVVSDPNAVVGNYKVPLKVEYKDSLNKDYSKDALISLSIKTAPEIFIIHEQTDIIKNGTKNSVTTSIVNRGLSKIKFMTATLAESTTGEYVILTPQDVYVGDINSDDSETAQYDLFINTDKGGISLPLTLTFKDESGNNYTITEAVSVRVFTTDEAVQYGLEQAVTTDPLIFGVAAVIALYVIYRIYKFVVRRRSNNKL